MGKNKRYPKAKKITLAQQMFALQADYPDGKCGIEKHKKLVWGGKVRPTPISQEYPVLMTWEQGRSPRVWVVGDNLQKMDDPEFPHKFHINEEKRMVRLCLYRYQEFNSSKLLSRTIIPWTVEWLYFYEIWLATGEWCGGGEHPAEGERKDDDAA